MKNYNGSDRLLRFSLRMPDFRVLLMKILNNATGARGVDPFFELGGGGGAKVRKISSFSARYARKVAVSAAKLKILVCSVVFLCNI